MLVGTTFAGHDWNTGSMSNQLLFEPRRAAGLGGQGGSRSLLAGAVAGARCVLAAYWVGALGWSPAPATSPAGRRRLADGRQTRAARRAVHRALGGLGGYALTMLFRSTVATLGVLFGVSVAGG